jgi:cytochrome c biogenesis protein CcdA
LTYALGMGLVMTAVSITIGISNQKFLRGLRKLALKMNFITSIVLILVGSYLIYYNLVVGNLPSNKDDK